MRVAILTLGTHGDVQPFVALGLGLLRAGHTVRLAARDSYREFVIGRGLEFASLGDLPAEVEESPGRVETLRRLPSKARRWGRIARSFLPGDAPGWPEATPWLDDLMERSWQACRDADVIVSGILCFWVCHFAE